MKEITRRQFINEHISDNSVVFGEDLLIKEELMPITVDQVSWRVLQNPVELDELLSEMVEAPPEDNEIFGKIIPFQEN